MAPCLEPRTHRSRVPRQILVLAIFAFTLKTVLAISAYGSIDILLFEAHVAKMKRDGPIALYRDGITTQWCGQSGQDICLPFNHPPFMTYVLKAWVGLSDISGLPVRFWLRFTCAVADVGSLAVLVSMLTAWPDERQTRIALSLFAACPMAILVSGFHGNTDPIMLFFLLLSVWIIQSRRPAWLAGAALGMAASVKIIPLALAPALLLSVSGSRRRLAFVAAAVLVFTAGSFRVFSVEPELIANRVLGYTPPSGVWGLPLVALITQEGLSTSVYDTYMRYAKALTVLLVGIASLWPRPRGRADTVLLRIGLLLSLMVWSAPGFGVQYLSWLVPWVVVLGVGATAIYYLAGSVFMLTYYAGTAGELGYLATTLDRHLWTATMLRVGLIGWLAVSWITFVFARRQIVTARRPTDEEAHRRS